eukprot:5649307-Pyramimonas_sp.AAC.1
MSAYNIHMPASTNINLSAFNIHMSAYNINLSASTNIHMSASNINMPACAVWGLGRQRQRGHGESGGWQASPQRSQVVCAGVHAGPIRHRKCRYILTTDQSDARPVNGL